MNIDSHNIILYLLAGLCVFAAYFVVKSVAKIVFWVISISVIVYLLQQLL